MFELATPWVLWLLPLPLLIWCLLPRTKAVVSSALKVPFFEAMETIVEHEKRSASAQKLLLIPISIWILLVLALAGPRWIGEPSFKRQPPSGVPSRRYQEAALASW